MALADDARLAHLLVDAIETRDGAPLSATARDVDPTTAEPEEHKPVLLPSGEPACVRCKVLPPAGLVPGHCRACGKIAAYGN